VVEFLADRTNGRAIGTVLCLSSVTWSIVAKRCVLEQKLHFFKVTIGIVASISPRLFELVTANLVSGFDLPLLFNCRVLHTIVYCEAVRSAILATAWLLV